ncbi:hypothetical protein FA13DRAFT_1797641 [Coprinellus micaceus]|uniref:Uncharacterized protein n=1 Tax=Coprinellus micaceus TaxID=71717 RepID=A0A4Y7SPY4_COPMI|nr:hypothetical protein FA13DRAFT_1797641 [Coprinellus micaceus]
MANSNEKPQAVPLSDAPTKRRSRKGTSTRKCIANMAAGVLVLVVAGYGLFMYYQFMFTVMGRPFPQLFANKTLDETLEEPWMVVQPQCRKIVDRLVKPISRGKVA